MSIEIVNPLPISATTTTLALTSSQVLTWNADTGISRNSADNFSFGNGAANDQSGIILAKALALGANIQKLNGIATVGDVGCPIVVAYYTSAVLTDNLGSTSFYNPSTTGLFRISAYLVVTVADGASSTLPSLVFSFSDRHIDTTNTITVTPTNTGNVAGTTFTQGSAIADADSGFLTHISTTGYTSGTPNTMKYVVRAYLEFLG